MPNHKNRLAQLEKRSDKQPAEKVTVIEIYGMSMDGTKHLVSRRILDPQTNNWVEEKVSDETIRTNSEP
ncbi:MAG: hypothetical protein ABI904_00880 [Chloroflexota bacterium]